MKIRPLLILLCLLLSLLSFACTDLGYYGQSVGGHLSMLSKRRPISDVMADPASSPSLKNELGLVLSIRDFAENELGLPVGGSFSTYADIHRPYVVWNVVAAPPYSLVPKEWCFPVAGCLPYRGYFSQKSAESYAESLRRDGYDVHVYGVSAYSTLGWFEDPVLNTFVHYPDWALAGLVFHEMAHQVVYAENDGDFNEAFATSVEIEGTRRWIRMKRPAEEFAYFLARKSREDAFYDLVDATRRNLLNCYDGRSAGGIEVRQSCKDQVLAGMRSHYDELKSSWGGDGHFDWWFKGDLNNARFVSARTYRYYLSAFSELLRRNNYDMKAYYRAARQIAEMPGEKRRIALNDLRTASLTAFSSTSEGSKPRLPN